LTPNYGLILGSELSSRTNFFDFAEPLVT